MTALRKSYLICCVQRSGSWLLANTLRDTGVAGRPSDYFDGAERDRNAATWATPDFPSYLDAVRARGTTANGVFGSKMMWNDFGPFLANLRTLDDERSALPDRELLEWTFPCLSFVWLRRKDKVRQGVSWWRAVATDQWVRHPGEESKEADLDVSRIVPLVKLAGEWDVAWREWFAGQRITPLEITYEELDEDRLVSVNHVLTYLALPPVDGRALPEARYRRQADDITERHVQEIRRITEQDHRPIRLKRPGR